MNAFFKVLTRNSCISLIYAFRVIQNRYQSSKTIRDTTLILFGACRPMHGPPLKCPSFFLKTYRFFCTGSQKTRFWKLKNEHIISILKLISSVSKLKNHLVDTFATVEIDLSVIRPFRLLCRTTFYLKILVRTYNGS